MIQTILIYLFLLITIVFLVSITFKIEGVSLSNNILSLKNFPLLIAMLLFALIFGMRYGVGFDHLSYLKYYEAIKSNYYDGKIMEPGFSYISNFFAGNSFHFSFYFSFLAFIQIFFLFNTFKRNEVRVLPFLVLTLFLSGMFISFMNGIRQQISFCIFIFSLEFVYRKKPIKHYLLIFLASLFHSSALLLLPVFFLYLFKRKYFSRVVIQLILLLIALYILYQNYLVEILSMFQGIISFLGYERYLDLIDNDSNSILFSLDKTRGIGFFIILIIDVLLIVYSNKVKRSFPNSFYLIIYDLYFIGVLIGYSTNGSIMFGRLNYYFWGFKFIVAAYTLLYLYKFARNTYLNKFYFVFLLGLYILLFVAMIYRMDDNTSRFLFFWQEHLYYLKI